MAEIIVDAKNVSMCFNLYSEKVDNLKEYFIKIVKKQLKHEEFWALKDISFTVEQGCSLGLIGRNGSGKSTLLKLLAGVMKPARGTIGVYGNVAPLIELGAGFDPDLTAKENIYLNGAVLGYSRREMQEKFDEIVDFSELHEFINLPVKNFSSGMYARLGFAIATIREPKILIVDEILSVGDFKFQEKCKERITKMISNGTTLLFVSHSKDDVSKLCQKAIWLDEGQMKMFGAASEVCDAYLHS